MQFTTVMNFKALISAKETTQEKLDLGRIAESLNLLSFDFASLEWLQGRHQSLFKTLYRKAADLLSCDSGIG